MKRYAVEVFFQRGQGVSGGIDDAPRLDEYATETVLLKLADYTLDGVKRQVHRQYPGAAYLHVLEVTELEEPLSPDFERIDVVNNIADTRIQVSDIHGYGLFAEKVITEGSVLARLDGQVVSYDFNARTADFTEWNALPGNRILVRPYRTKYSFINHSRTPNCRVRMDDRHNVVVVEALLDVVPGAELTLDYRKEPLPDSYVSAEVGAYL
ncbi:MAG: hypothetical protein AWU57_186 [Marinobacter sp. T13-3]|nr:MAG: hypothetical protein AWU57_186 [Marinobacter sp. T13-3]